MQLWLVCFLLLFFGAEGLQWLGQMPGLGAVDLSVPGMVLGGIGLAIASNYRHQHRKPPLPPDGPRQAEAPPASPIAPRMPSFLRSPSSISFEIRKPQ